MTGASLDRRTAQRDAACVLAWMPGLHSHPVGVEDIVALHPAVLDRGSLEMTGTQSFKSRLFTDLKIEIQRNRFKPKLCDLEFHLIYKSIKPFRPHKKMNYDVVERDDVRER